MCGKGFVLANETCTDFDECKKKSPNKVKLLSDGYVSCSAGATCHNNIGGYACVCEYGFRTEDVSGRETTECSDIDECVKNNVCPDNAECENSQNGRQ